jgi:DNA methylase
MTDAFARAAPGRIRDAITEVFRNAGTEPLSLVEIELGVIDLLGPVSPSSVRSYLNLNTPGVFERTKRGSYRVKQAELPLSIKAPRPAFRYLGAQLFHGDCFEVMSRMAENSVHAIVTDPPYGLVEFSDKEVAKLRGRKGGVWRMPPAFDGSKRSPLPRFTVLTPADLRNLEDFFVSFARALGRVSVPGANILVASNPLLSHCVAGSLARGGLEPRGTIVRLVMTMRGGDRPKNAHEEFDDVSVMPRSMWEPWLCFRNPLDGRVQDNLRRWGTGGFRRLSKDRPFGDVILSSPTSATERKHAQHPSLKPQALLRQLVRASLPLSKGVILDPFAGSGSTLAAANVMGVDSVGIEKDATFIEMARSAIPALTKLESIDPIRSQARDSPRVKRGRART